MSESTSTFRLTPRLVLGLGVLLAGIMLTVDQLELYDAQLLFDYWPVLIMAVGATRIASSKTSDRIFTFFWIAVGAWLLAWNLGYLDLNPLELFWPLVLILFGLTLVFRATRRPSTASDADSRTNIIAVMSGIDRQNSSLDFSGGDVTVFMGGGELDLRQAQVASGEAVIQIFAMWGGYGFRVPPDWNVVLEIVPLLGGVTDLRTQHERREGAPTLTLKGVVIMGGIELKS